VCRSCRHENGFNQIQEAELALGEAIDLRFGVQAGDRLHGRRCLPLVPEFAFLFASLPA
jgi:hypothetical protein